MNRITITVAGGEEHRYIMTEPFTVSIGNGILSIQTATCETIYRAGSWIGFKSEDNPDEILEVLDNPPKWY